MSSFFGLCFIFWVATSSRFIFPIVEHFVSSGLLRHIFRALSVFVSAVGSQATITASFSIINQCLALGCFPRVKVIRKIWGQVYIPDVNWLLMLPFHWLEMRQVRMYSDILYFSFLGSCRTEVLSPFWFENYTSLELLKLVLHRLITTRSIYCSEIITTTFSTRWKVHSSHHYDSHCFAYPLLFWNC